MIEMGRIPQVMLFSGEILGRYEAKPIACLTFAKVGAATA